MSVCYTGKCPDMQIKIVETPNKFSVNVKTNLNTFNAIYRDSDQLLDELPAALNALDT